MAIRNDKCLRKDFVQTHRDYSSPPLPKAGGGHVPRPPVDAWNQRQYRTLYILFFSYMYIPMIKFNLQIRHRKSSTTNDKIEQIHCNTLCECNLFLKISYCTVLTLPVTMWDATCLHDEGKWGRHPGQRDNSCLRRDGVRWHEISSNYSQWYAISNLWSVYFWNIPFNIFGSQLTVTNWNRRKENHRQGEGWL